MKSSQQVIEEVRKMNWLQKQLYYIQYYSRVYLGNYFSFETHKRGVVCISNRKEPVSFIDFCSEENIGKTFIGEKWKEQGFAAESWTTFFSHTIFWWHHHYPKI